MSSIRRYSYHEILAAIFDTSSNDRLVPELPAELLKTQWSVNPREDSSVSFDLIPETVVFTTSGSTGKPKSVRKSRFQIALEAEAVSEVVVQGSSTPDEVISFAPPNHAFGFLCGIALSLRFGIPFTYNSVDAAIPVAGDGINSSLILALPASFRTLEKSEHAFTSRHRTVVVQSAGPASPRYAETIEALQPNGVEGFEIYGSSEAGAIGHRRTDVAPHAWTLFDDIELLPPCDTGGAPSEMIVGGPRCTQVQQDSDMGGFRSNQSPSVRTGDIVRFVGDRRFALVGRLDRVIQINGLNTDLDVLQHRLSLNFEEVDFFVEKQLDALRGHGFVVHFFCKGSTAYVERMRREIAYIVGENYPKHVYPSKIQFWSAPLRRSHSGKIIGLPITSPADARIDVL
ncbi:AMP-binding protein [Rhizobium pusense]|uniref:AMP-binding protein n=1 Tax=Agrobacterium pusense TaxID=648995 RepID=UPI002448AE3A|nr:AMP-binding protein [Agrobacterium pusense]MDH1270480.1 AMP-binding protein [Agrobacterium pusense]